MTKHIPHTDPQSASKAPPCGESIHATPRVQVPLPALLPPAPPPAGGGSLYQRRQPSEPRTLEQLSADLLVAIDSPAQPPRLEAAIRDGLDVVRSNPALLRATQALASAVDAPALALELGCDIQTTLPAAIAEMGVRGLAAVDLPPSPPLQYPPPIAAPPPKPVDTRSRRQRAKDKQAARAAKRRNAYVEKMKSKGMDGAACPPECPLPVYQLVQSILGDLSGRRTVRILEEECRMRSGYHLGILRDVLNSTTDFRKYESRELVAAAVLFYRLAERTERVGRWPLLVRGYSLAWLSGVLHFPGDPTNRRHRSQLGGGGRKHPEQKAKAYTARWIRRGHTAKRTRPQRAPLLQRLRDAGLLYAQQLSWDEADPCERDTRGASNPKFKHTRNRYWLKGLTLRQPKRTRAQRNRAPVSLEREMTNVEYLAQVNALQDYGQEWVTQCRAALSTRDGPPLPLTTH